MFYCADTDPVELCPKTSSKNKEVSPFIPLQAGYRSKKQSSTHIWLYVTSLGISFPQCYVTLFKFFKFYLSALLSLPPASLSEHSLSLSLLALLPATILMHRWHAQESHVLRVLEPVLRMKAQVDSSSRGLKDFICREEKRKTAWLGMQGDPETSDPLGQVKDWVFLAFLHCLRAEMSLQCRQKFPRKKRCLLDHLSPFGTACSLSFNPPSQWSP
jgi:hypothetical protein